MSMKSPLQLYKYLLRRIQLLPPEAQAYYNHHVKQAYKSHSDETDPERIHQIIERAMEDAEWVVLKYKDKR